jgi:transposase
MPVIPPTSNRHIQVAINGATYAPRNRIERAINRLNNARRVATRNEKIAASYLGFVQLAAIRLWLKHLVNSASIRNTRSQTAHQLPDARSA